MEAPPKSNDRRDNLPIPTSCGLAVGGLWLLGRLVDEVRIERVRLGTRVTLRRAIGPAGTRAR